eukprot:gene11160-3982_t
MNDVSELINFIKLSKQDEIKSENEIRKLILQNSKNLSTKSQALFEISNQIKQSENESKELNKLIENSYQMAKEVSIKAQKLHLVQIRAQSCLKNVEGQMGLKDCVKGVKEAIEKCDYEEATKLVSSVLDLDEQIVIEKENSKLIKKSESDVKEMIIKEFKNSLKNENEKEKEKFATLLLSLKIEKEGLNLLLNEIKFKFKNELNEVYQIYEQENEQSNVSLNEQSNTPHNVPLNLSPNEHDSNTLNEENINFEQESIIDLMKYIIDCSAYHIESNYSFILKYFGSSQIEFFLNDILILYDEISLKLFNEYESFHFLNSIKKNESKKIDYILEELMQLFNILQNFERFILQFKYNFKRVSKFTKKVEHFIEIFIELDYYYLSYCVKKAIEMDLIEEEQDDDDDDNESDSDDDNSEHICSSMISDSFYIFKQNLERNIQTNNLNIIKGGIDNIISILNENLKTEISNSTFSSSQGGVGILNKMIGLNNTESISEYIIHLKIQFEKLIKDVSVSSIGGGGSGGGGVSIGIGIGNNNSNDESFEEEKKKINLTFTQTSIKFKEILKSGMKYLIKNHFEGSLMFHLESFIDVDYNITENGFLFYENNDPLIKKFIFQFDKLSLNYKSKLSQNNFDLFIQECVSIIISKIELIIFKKSFSQFGGLQFDKDIRSLMIFFSNKTHKTVRDKFLRLTQISSLLKMFKINEVLDYQGENQVLTWRLTPNEIRNVLYLRNDFSKDSIKKLKL